MQHHLARHAYRFGFYTHDPHCLRAVLAFAILAPPWTELLAWVLFRFGFIKDRGSTDDVRRLYALAMASQEGRQARPGCV